jgi:hypothetical protein
MKLWFLLLLLFPVPQPVVDILPMLSINTRSSSLKWVGKVPLNVNVFPASQFSTLGGYFLVPDLRESFAFPPT